MYEVRLSPKAQKFYERVDRPLARKLARCFEQLESDPRGHANVRALAGKLQEHDRFRVGDYRVIYRIDDEQRLVRVVKITHRSNAYR